MTNTLLRKSCHSCDRNIFSGSENAPMSPIRQRHPGEFPQKIFNRRPKNAYSGLERANTLPTVGKSLTAKQDQTGFRQNVSHDYNYLPSSHSLRFSRVTNPPQLADD